MRTAPPLPVAGRARRLVLVAAAALVALLGILAAPTPVLAHTALTSSAPASGARLSTVPRELRLTFSEAIELAVSRLELLGPDGAAVRLATPARFRLHLARALLHRGALLRAESGGLRRLRRPRRLRRRLPCRLLHMLARRRSC
ncbi:MAG TPA: copper resistance CopC family protein, partial [Gemmatimonadaceae bacterium]